MTLSTLPWQDIGAALLGLLAVAHLTRRWWPGRAGRSGTSCHGSEAPARTASGACQGGCSGCPSSRSH